MVNALFTLAQDLPPMSGEGGGSALGGLIFLLVWLAIIVVCIAGMWKTFTKAGQPGWACIIPIYNLIVLLQIAGRPIWWFILFLIPIVNLVVAIILCIDIAKSFGKGAGFAIGLLFLGPIFYCILGFGSATYQGPAAAAPLAA